MVRILSITVAFLIVTIGLLFFQPEKSQAPDLAVLDNTNFPDPSAAIDDILVSRAQVNLVETPQIAASGPMTATSDDDFDENATMRALTLGALGNLSAITGNQITQAPLEIQQQKVRGVSPTIRSLTDTALSNLSSQIGNDTANLEALIIQAIRQGQSEDALKILLGQNGDINEIDVPAELKTTDGSMDSRILLAALVSKSNNGNISNELLDVLQMPSADSQPQTKLSESQHYTVQSGDSLAGIAFRFYGKTSAYRAIYLANQSAMASPDKIKAGQILLIPVL